MSKAGELVASFLCPKCNRGLLYFNMSEAANYVNSENNTDAWFDCPTCSESLYLDYEAKCVRGSDSPFYKKPPS